MTALAPAPSTGSSLIVTMANRYGLEPAKFYSTLEKTILPSSGKTATQEQVAAFLVVANHYQLNPFVKEIFAFPSQGGGITPIVSVDGWLTLINRQPALDGIAYEDHLDDDGNLTAITCRIFRKDRTHPNEITEYMSECKRGTQTWSQWPSRMLRHKALIQCARQAFGLAGIYDPDEAERIAEAEGVNGHSNGHQIAEKTRAKVDEMTQRYAPAEVVAQDPAESQDAPQQDYVDSTIHETPDDSDAGLDSETENLRASVTELLGGLDKSAQKNFIAGKTPVSKATKDELLEMYEQLKP